MVAFSGLSPIYEILVVLQCTNVLVIVFKLVRFVAVADGTGCHRKQHRIVQIQVLRTLRHQPKST